MLAALWKYLGSLKNTGSHPRDSELIGLGCGLLELKKNLGDCNELPRLRTKALEPPMQKTVGLVRVSGDRDLKRATHLLTVS